MAHDVFRKGNGYPDRRLMHPQREWTIGLLVFIVIIAVGGVFAGRLLVTYRDINIEGDAGENIPRYSENRTTRALDLYRTKSVKFESERSIVPVVEQLVAEVSEDEDLEVGLSEAVLPQEAVPQETPTLEQGS